MSLEEMMRAPLYSILFVSAFFFAGCTSPAPKQGGPTYQDGSVAIDHMSISQDGSVVDGQIVTVTDKVYAHSEDTLYEIDPNNLTVTVVGAFVWPGGSFNEQMTDIALDEEGNMIGISFYSVYSVDKDTAECTFLSDLQGTGFNGLSYVEGVGVDPQEKTLVGVNQSGGYYAIDPNTGVSTAIGSYGNGLMSSGDLVFVRGAGVFATAKHSSYTTDVLVSVNAPTGQATIIGETGFNDIWGLAYWTNRLFGFTDYGQFLLIDTTTGQGTLVETASNNFWGAGVTTVAPIVE